ncbi:MAG: Lrp/AsnC family transcriptional regulator [Candidatus Lokiarchaeota archaeon]|nr:Lrp/AsnC family transcriptional regulator [Candidatus Lokiarchaeota archaeon]
MKDKELASVEDVDLNILGILSENSRENYNQIAQILKKSPVTIKKHVEELEKNGVIKGYGINIDFEKLGYDIIATIEITVSKGKMIEVETDIAENPNVFGVYDITGDYDALIFARFKTRKELSEMIKKLHASSNVVRTNTHLILNVIKEGSSFVKLLEKEKKET